jgi:hypothetical protein
MSRASLIAILVAAAVFGFPPAVQAAPPICVSPNVGVPHNATIPIFLCQGAVNFDITSAPQHGVVSGASAGWRNYTPNAGYAGADTFSYSATLAGETSTGTVTLEIAPGTKPVCFYRAETVPQATLTPLSLLCATGGDPITGYGLSTAAHGTLTGLDVGLGKVSYQSAAGYSGPDSFTYTATTAFGTSNPATFDLTVLNPQQGPPGPPGPQGPQGPQGPAGPTVLKDRLVLASFEDALTARRGRGVVVRYLCTTAATVELDVFRGSRRVARASGRARTGVNSIRWNGKSGGAAAPAGIYRLVLRATSGDQQVSDRATVRITR